MIQVTIIPRKKGNIAACVIHFQGDVIRTLKDAKKAALFLVQNPKRNTYKIEAIRLA